MDTPEGWSRVLNQLFWLIGAPSTHCQDDSVPLQEICQFVQESSSAWGIHLSPWRAPLERCLRCLHCIIHIRLHNTHKKTSGYKEGAGQWHRNPSRLLPS